MDKLIEQFEHLKMTAASKDVNEDPSIKDLIETYSKAVLDCTFFHENYLTEHNFRLESTDEDIVTTLHLLDSIVALCASVDKSGHKLDEIQSLSQITSTPSTLTKTKTNSGDSYQSVVNVLGIDFGECILWRQGSLLYAFCSAKLSSDPCWVKSNQNRLLARLRDGINYFHLMLSLRGDLISPLLREDHGDNSTYSQQSDKSPSPSIHVDYPRAQQNIAFVSAKDFNLNNSANVLGKLLLQKQQIVGALGQELDELQKSLDEQQSFHQAIQEDIEQKLYRNPEMRSHLEPALAEITLKKEEVREQQEKNVEKKHQIEECLKQLQSQQDELAPAARAPSPNADSHRFAGENAVNTLELIDMGIMSDSHMLAMMYCGDMSFWFCKYSQDWNFLNSNNRINFEEIKNIGISYLKIYIRAVERILRFNGWNCERAKDLLKYFSELK